MAKATGISILRARQVRERTGLSRSTLYAKIKAGEFPRSISLGDRAVGWSSAEIDAWIGARIDASVAGRKSRQGEAA
jgi:prophage regulatory protein